MRIGENLELDDTSVADTPEWTYIIYHYFL